MGLFSPLPGSAIKFRASLYADDMVVFLRPFRDDLRCLKELLDVFAGASDLVTNYNKCQLTPIRCSQEEAPALLESFPYRVAEFPCRYLGFRVAVLRLKRYKEQGIIDALASKIPTWKSGLLIDAGRVLLTKVTMSAIPIHISRWAIKGDRQVQACVPLAGLHIDRRGMLQGGMARRVRSKDLRWLGCR